MEYINVDKTIDLITETIDLAINKYCIRKDPKVSKISKLTKLLIKEQRKIKDKKLKEYKNLNGKVSKEIKRNIRPQKLLK